METPLNVCSLQRRCWAWYNLLQQVSGHLAVQYAHRAMQTQKSIIQTSSAYPTKPTQHLESTKEKAECRQAHFSHFPSLYFFSENRCWLRWTVSEGTGAGGHPSRSSLLNRQLASPLSLCPPPPADWDLRGATWSKSGWLASAGCLDTSQKWSGRVMRRNWNLSSLFSSSTCSS